MRRSIELGRAVLSTPAANLELWLRTLITISPQQQYADLEQHNAASLLEILSSGKVWVGRGNGLYVDLEITFGHQPVADGQLRQLSKAILGAPVWKQLSLQPSLLQDVVQSPGKLRIAVTYANESAAPMEKQSHRILSSTSGAHVRPPEVLSLLSLDSVLLCADIFELPERTKAATGKRLKISTSNGNLLQPKLDGDIRDPEPEVSDEPTFTSPATLKRARTSALPDVETVSPNLQMDLNNPDLETLIDGALRISVLGRINNRILPGVKLKANTFEFGLADVAPILWKPGHLSSLSQRVSLIPIISRSLCHAAATKGTSSPSFEKILSAVTTPSSILRNPVHELSRECVSGFDANHLAPSITSRLWLHLQRNTPCKSSAVLQSFVSADLSSPLDSQIDELLDEPGQGCQIHRRSRLLAVGPLRGETDDCHHRVKDCPATIMTYRGLPLQHPVPRTVTTPSDKAKEVRDELLLGDEIFEPLNVVT